MARSARGHDRIAGVELGAVPIAAAVSLETDLPYLMVRKAAKEHGWTTWVYWLVGIDEDGENRSQRVPQAG